jgi:hypothetical protein
MKLTELATPKKSRQVAQVFESYFGTKMPVNKLTVREAQAMLKRVRGVIAEHQRSTTRHTSERNPAYLKLVMMEQALAHRVSEDMAPTHCSWCSTEHSTKCSRNHCHNKRSCTQSSIDQGVKRPKSHT